MIRIMLPVTLVLTISAPNVAAGQAHQPHQRHRGQHAHHSPGCNTNSCDRRTARRMELRRTGCLTRACYARIRLRDWRATIEPYVVWLAAVRSCESSGDYTIDTHNGFYGAYQFTLPSWRSVGGAGMPNQAPPIEQDYRAVLLLHAQGRGAWPICG